MEDGGGWSRKKSKDALDGDSCRAGAPSHTAGQTPGGRRGGVADARVAQCDARALRHAEALSASGWAPLLTTPQRVFSLMPLRHSPTVARLRHVLEQAWAGVPWGVVVGVVCPYHAWTWSSHVCLSGVCT